jgi:hypothetical protein
LAYTGGIGATLCLFPSAADPDLVQPYLNIKGKALTRHAPFFFELLKDMAHTPDYSDKARLRELLLQHHLGLEHRLTQSAIHYAVNLASSSFSQGGALYYEMYGLPYLFAVRQLVRDLDQNIESCCQQLQQLRAKLLGRSGSHLVVGCDEKSWHMLQQNDFFGIGEHCQAPTQLWQPALPLVKKPDCAYKINSQVAYNALVFQGVSYASEDAPYLRLGGQLLQNGVLHTVLREQGGAYGYGANLKTDLNTFTLYSYRDPHIAASLKTFKEGLEAIAAGKFSATDLEEAKLSILQHTDAPLPPGERATAAFQFYLRGQTLSMRQRQREHLLKATPQQVAASCRQRWLPAAACGQFVTFAGGQLLEKEAPQLPIFSI